MTVIKLIANPGLNLKADDGSSRVRGKTTFAATRQPTPAMKLAFKESPQDRYADFQKFAMRG